MIAPDREVVWLFFWIAVITLIAWGTGVKRK